MASTSAAKGSMAPISAPVDFSSPIDYSLLQGKRALVTGGSSGLGEGIVRMLAEAGADVTIADINEERGQALESELNIAGYRTGFVQVDAASWASQVSMFKASASKAPLDIIVVSAGVGESPPDLSPADISTIDAAERPKHRAIDIGLIGSYYTVNLALKYGMDLGRRTEEVATSTDSTTFKSITLLGSMAGFTGIPGGQDYSASKFGIRGLFQSLTPVMLEGTVRINELTPFFIDTPMTRPIVPVLEKRGIKLGKLEDVVLAAARLATDPRIHGRAVCISSEGQLDMGDDAAGGYGALALRQLHGSGALGGRAG